MLSNAFLTLPIPPMPSIIRRVSHSLQGTILCDLGILQATNLHQGIPRDIMLVYFRLLIKVPHIPKK